MRADGGTDATRVLVQAVYDCFKRRDLEGIGRHLADDVDWHIEGPSELFRFCGMRKGREAALSATRELLEDYEHLGHDVRFLLVDGHRACLYARATIRDRSTGKVASADICDLMEIKDGKIAWFRELFDTLSASEQMQTAA